MESVYIIADHTRCLAFMLADGVIPIQHQRRISGPTYFKKNHPLHERIESGRISGRYYENTTGIPGKDLSRNKETPESYQRHYQPGR